MSLPVEPLPIKTNKRYHLTFRRFIHTSEEAKMKKAIDLFKELESMNDMVLIEEVNG